VQFCFSNHVLDVDLRELTRGGESIAVEPQVFDLLVHLIRNRDHVVTKDDLIDTVWDGRIVSESTLTSRINAARKAVGDSGKDQIMIRTIARKGFRFVGDVQPRAANGSEVQRDVPRPPAPAAEPQHRHSPALDRTAIAVLPFANLSGEPEQEYFSEGISEDIITALSKLRWFYVIARNSSFIYRGKSVHHQQIGEELGVGYVVEGSVRKDGDHVRITAQLVDVATGSHLWAERYDRDLADVFAVQDEITQAVVAAIEPQLYAAEDFRARRKTPDNMAAWDLVMRALSHYWRVTRQDNLVAQALLEKAISVDPQYGQALGLLAACHTFSAHMGWEELSKVIPVAERAALAAIRADSEDPWAHYALASVYLFQGRFDDCIAEFELALQLNPSFSPARGAETEPPRPLCRDLLRRRRLLPVYRPQLCRGDPPVPRSAASAQRLRRRSPRAGGLTGNGRQRGCRQSRTRRPPPRPAQHLAGVARDRTAVRARGGQGALSGGI
jgi:TolB-like protein